MGRFIVVTFAFLAWAFYEMSGGAEFVPAKAHLKEIRTDPLKPAESQTASLETATDALPEVTRASLNLSSTQDVVSGTQTQRLPQQTTPVVARTTEAEELPAPAQGESVSIIPSLVTGADDATPAAQEETTALQTAAVVTSVGGDLRSVKGNRVNMRGGPGTGYPVVGKLVRGDEVEVLEDLGNGWVRLRVIDTGDEGWMADFLLTGG